jgi:tripartite-type tricarboxylate transporter receptor subunit TctC
MMLAPLLVRLSVALLVSALAFAALADSYPSRPVTLVVTSKAGSGPDALGRFVAQKLSPRLGQSVVVENKPGAGSMIAANYAAKAPPDGHTLLLATLGSVALTPVLNKKPLVNPRTDFVSLVMTSQNAFFLSVNPKLPINSVQDLIRVAKERPGQMTYGTSGPGSAPHIFMELLMKLSGIKMIAVPYPGSGASTNDLVAGHIDVVFADAAVIDLAKSGRVRIIGISTKTRHEAFPDIPSIAESGLPAFNAAAWNAVVTAAKTPPDIVKKLQVELSEVVKHPEFKAYLLKRGSTGMDDVSTPEEMRAFVDGEIDRWGDVVRSIGLAGSQ